MESEMTELGKKVLIDVQSEIWKYYDSVSVEYEDKEKPEDTIMKFFPICID